MKEETDIRKLKQLDRDDALKVLRLMKAERKLPPDYEAYYNALEYIRNRELPNNEALSYLNEMRVEGELPDILNICYKKFESDRIKTLPKNEAFGILDKMKAEGRLPDFLVKIYDELNVERIKQLPSEEALRVLEEMSAQGEISFSLSSHHASLIEALPAEQAVKVLEPMLAEGEIPVMLGIFFEKLYWTLTDAQKRELYNVVKKRWYEKFSDFRKIACIMKDFRINEMLIEYSKGSPPTSILEAAVDVYKKCISYKVKLTDRVLSNLKPGKGIRYNVQYCIDRDAVHTFLNEFQTWSEKANRMWPEVYNAKANYFGYSHNWFSIVRYPDQLKMKVDEIEGLHKRAFSLLLEGQELLTRHDETISSEYSAHAFDMSLYEREQEIARMALSDNVSDEHYCYVYTLECKLLVFYVGIAANPNERFEQHLRGAFGDEAHLFKSKFIQKYRKEIKMQVVYEGTRRECKLFEKAYIAEHGPLGNDGRR